MEHRLRGKYTKTAEHLLLKCEEKETTDFWSVFKRNIDDFVKIVLCFYRRYRTKLTG